MREFGAIRVDCCKFETVDIYADNESTTAFTKASLESDRLDETDRSTAVEFKQQQKGHASLLTVF